MSGDLAVEVVKWIGFGASGLGPVIFGLSDGGGATRVGSSPTAQRMPRSTRVWKPGWPQVRSSWPQAV